MILGFMYWRRVDVPGHDACRLERSGAGYRLSGAAVFRDESGLGQLSYEVSCDAEWRSKRGRVRGWIERRDLDLDLEFVRTARGWSVNGKPVRGHEHTWDLDLAFTPSTNLTQIRRARLRRGQSADVPVAWFDLPNRTLVELPQRYERRSAATYWYESPTSNYQALLEVNAQSFVTKYPELWEAEP
jgi:hypothetical protein